MSRAIEILNESELNWVREEDEGFGALRTSRGILPLARMDVHARLSGMFTRTTVEQTFVNNFDEPLEATYVFPLPDRAAVVGFRLDVDGRAVVGELKERGEARREYAQAIQTGHRAAIAEEERPGVFTMRAGNIMPGEHARIRLEIVGQLSTRGDEATFRFPLVVAPRYMPGRALGDDVGSGIAHDTDQVPDASRISPPVLLHGYPNPVRLSITVDIDPVGLPISNICSSLHSVMVDDDNHTGNIQRIRVVPGERLNRDFILRFSLGRESVGAGLRFEPDSDGSANGTFALTIVPPRRDTIVRKPRDVVFVLDRSGSMGGWKMVAARRAVARMVESLDYDDHFSVLAFDHTVEAPPMFGKQLVRATDRNRYLAGKFVNKIAARGGTQMLAPLRDATTLLRGDLQNDRVVVLVTDGQVGNESQIVSLFQKKLNGARVFTVGVDRAVNATFLRRLADLGGGGTELVEDENRLEEVMASIHRRIDTPVWSQLSLAPRGFDIVNGSLAPKMMPDVFPGNPVVITGRYQGRPEGASLEVHAVEASGARLSQRTPAVVGGEGLIGKIWARGRIRDLEDSYDAHGARSGSGDIVKISLDFGVMCRFTSFVAVDRAVVVNEGGMQHQVTQPVETPEGWSGQSAPAGMKSPSRRRQSSARAPAPMDKSRSEPMMRSAAPASKEMNGFESGRAAPMASPAFAQEMDEELEMDDGFMDSADDGFMDGGADFGSDEGKSVEIGEVSLSNAAGPAAPLPPQSPPQTRGGGLSRLVDAGRAVLGGAQKKKPRRAPTGKNEVLRRVLAFATEDPRGHGPQRHWLTQLLARLDDCANGGWLGLSLEYEEALRKLTLDVRSVLARSTSASSNEFDALTRRCVEILRAIENDDPIPPVPQKGRSVGRGEDFWQ